MKHGATEFIKSNFEMLMDEVPEPEVKAYHADSQSMKEVDSRSVDLVVTSPPYPEVEMWEEQFGDYDDIHDMIYQVLLECHAVLTEGGIACINIGDATSSSKGNFQCYPNHAEILMNAREIGFDTLVPIHWFKPTNRPNSFLGSGFLPSNAYVTQDTEYILILRKGGPREIDSNLLRQASQYTKEQRDSWFSQQWKVKGETQDGFAVFPREIPYRLIRMFSVLGDTVLDPFAGTGTTLEVAASLGRSAIGYEVGEGEIWARCADKEHASYSVEDILENIVKSEEIDEFGADEFVQNPNSLIDFM